MELCWSRKPKLWCGIKLAFAMLCLTHGVLIIILARAWSGLFGIEEGQVELTVTLAWFILSWHKCKMGACAAEGLYVFIFCWANHFGFSFTLHDLINKARFHRISTHSKTVLRCIMISAKGVILRRKTTFNCIVARRLLSWFFIVSCRIVCETAIFETEILISTFFGMSNSVIEVCLLIERACWDVDGPVLIA